VRFVFTPPAEEAAGLLSLPWDEPLESWQDDRLVEIRQRGILPEAPEPMETTAAPGPLNGDARTQLAGGAGPTGETEVTAPAVEAEIPQPLADTSSE
jgi:hypothetical protein